jgi:hypothetical protein
MPEWTDSDEGGIGVLPEKKTRLEKPKLFKVILHNDDFTTMDFVVFVLEYIFSRSEAERPQLRQRSRRYLPLRDSEHEIAKSHEPRKIARISAAVHCRRGIKFFQTGWT